jgi:hypothetical protein
MKQVLILFSFLVLSCNNSHSTNELPKDKKIWYTYLYYQKLAEKEAGCVDQNDINCSEAFNRIWPRYSDQLNKDFQVNDNYVGKVLQDAINNEAATKDWTDSRLSAEQLKAILKL